MIFHSRIFWKYWRPRVAKRPLTLCFKSDDDFMRCFLRDCTEELQQERRLSESVTTCQALFYCLQKMASSSTRFPVYWTGWQSLLARYSQWFISIIYGKEVYLYLHIFYGLAHVRWGLGHLLELWSGIATVCFHRFPEIGSSTLDSSNFSGWVCRPRVVSILYNRAITHLQL